MTTISAPTLQHLTSPSPSSPRQLSQQLRLGRSPELHRRRWVVGLSLLGAAMGQVVALYQTGIVRHLPDPPISLFDSDKVDASDYAYKRLQTPDALLMVVTYGLTATLAGAGGERRAAEQPWLPLLTAAKVLIDAGSAVQLGREEWKGNRKLCAYCQLATAASLASLVLALPEARQAWATLRR